MLQLPFEHHYGLGSFRHLTFWHWTFQGRHFVSLDVVAQVRFGIVDILARGHFGMVDFEISTMTKRICDKTST